ncbi:MAG: ring-cleaving dioxygenase [Bacteroidota bacterium]
MPEASPGERVIMNTPESNHHLFGIHHITALASDPLANIAFYTRVLGLRLVKKTVNFDSPDVYHLYYGDESGRPGTLLTFFPFLNAIRGKRGSGEVAAIAYHVPRGSLDFWIRHLSRNGVVFQGPEERFGETIIMFPDPDGLMLELIFDDHVDAAIPWKNGAVPPEHALRSFHGATLWLRDAGPTDNLLTATMGFQRGPEQPGRIRYFAGEESDRSAVDVVVRNDVGPGRQSAGSVHHIAWRVGTDEAQAEWRQTLAGLGLDVTEIVNRVYFRSVYFREPGRILFEIATDLPGMSVDENQNELGTGLQLPPWFEHNREAIERVLPALETKHTTGKTQIPIGP